MPSNARRIALAVVTTAVSFMVRADELVVDEKLQSVMNVQIDLSVCADTALTFENDNASAQKYSDLSVQLLDKAGTVGWTTDEIAIASVLVMENRRDLVLKDDDTLEEYRLRNYTGDRCDRQVEAAQRYLSGNFPTPE